MTGRTRAVLAIAGMSVVLGGIAGVPGAGAAHRIDPSQLPVELSPCLRWADALPVELTRGSAREAIICLVNAERAAIGLRALEPNRRLRRASQRHTAAMHGTGCFSHRCRGERGLRKRLKRYIGKRPRRSKYGEVIAWQPAALATPRHIVDGLLSSPRHRYHLLHPKYEEMGVGFAVGTPWSALALGGIYTIDFGMRID